MAGVSDRRDLGLLYVPDLGSDMVRLLKMHEDGGLEELEGMCFRNLAGAGGSGGGPRHMALHPLLDMCYCLHELGSVISAVAMKGGRLPPVTISGLRHSRLSSLASNSTRARARP